MILLVIALSSIFSAINSQFLVKSFSRMSLFFSTRMDMTLVKGCQLNPGFGTVSKTVSKPRDFIGNSFLF